MVMMTSSPINHRPPTTTEVHDVDGTPRTQSDSTVGVYSTEQADCRFFWWCGMGLIIGGSFAFSVGAAFMKPSQGLTRLVPTLIVILAFSLGALMTTKAVAGQSTSTAVVVGLGIEAVVTIIIGVLVLGDHLTVRNGLGIALVLGGVFLVR
jgi:multidrug transporter EmrE-like cation transporter